MPKEYIEREALINRFEYYRSHNLPGGNVEKAYSIAMKEVAQAPAADVVEVVRCKECKHYSKYGHCKLLSVEADSYSYGAYVNMDDNDFCSYGERKDGDDNAAD